MLKEVNLFHGPNHPGMHGNFSVHLTVDGDTVVKAIPNPGMLHRGFEKLMERRFWISNLALIPRICVPEPDINEAVYSMAAENIAGLEVPERAQFIRMIVLELARITVHMMALGGIGGPTGLYTAPNWGLTDRDKILDIFEKITGARVYHMYIIPGGVRNDINQDIIDHILRMMDYFEKHLPEYKKLVLEHPIIYKRLKGIAPLTRDQAISWGVTGPGIRATGVDYDVRKYEPYFAYDKVEFDIPTETDGDAYARMSIKYKEMFQSIRIIRQAIEKMPEGPVNVKPKGNALRWRIPKGEYYARVESSRGEYGYYMVSNGEERPYRVAVRGASYPQGLYGIEKGMPGTRLEDVAIWLDTMGVCAPEIDR